MEPREHVFTEFLMKILTLFFVLDVGVKCLSDVSEKNKVEHI